METTDAQTCEMTEAERRAVGRLRVFLSEHRGATVSEEEALAEWHAKYAVRWRQCCQARALERQRHEIEQHKWLESEKAQRDLGREAALDWIRCHAADWRAWFDTCDELDDINPWEAEDLAPHDAGVS